MKKSTAALSLTALIAASGIYYTSTTLASAIAAVPDQPADAAAYATAPASDSVFTAIPGPSQAATPLADLPLSQWKTNATSAATTAPI